MTAVYFEQQYELSQDKIRESTLHEMTAVYYEHPYELSQDKMIESTLK